MQSIASVFVCLSLAFATLQSGSHANEPPLSLDAAVDLFFAAQPQESARLFDAIVLAQPQLEPSLWQRGLALYYADRFADGQRQFELHRTVNPNDIENPAWHFACVARAKSLQAAQQAMLPVGRDLRVPLTEVLAFYKNSLDEQAVLAAADRGTQAAQRNQRCYAHLYLGLYYEATGAIARAREHMLLAATKYSMAHFMGQVAQMHVKLRGWNEPLKKDALE